MVIGIAPDSFKGTLSAAAAAAAIAAGLRRALPGARFRLIPMADGGEGTVDAVVAATRGRCCRCAAHDPLGRAIRAEYGLTGGFWNFMGGFDINTAGFVIVGVFVVTWIAALAIWHFGKIEQKWDTRQAVTVTDGATD